jgi:xylan 1,4-beta-xylosidase
MPGTAAAGAVPKVKLHIAASDAKCAFEYAEPTGEWKPLVKHADAKIMTDAEARGFVGATVGIYARIDK